jgi:hypothetical protein
VLVWIVAQAVALGYVDADTGAVALQATSTILAGLWVLGDAWLRGRRAAAVAVVQAEAISRGITTALPPPPEKAI